MAKPSVKSGSRAKKNGVKNRVKVRVQAPAKVGSRQPGVAHIPAPKSALVLINTKSGTVRSRGADTLEALVRDGLSQTFASLDVVLFEGDIAPHLERSLAAKSHGVIIAGGGDGTIASAAGLLIGSGVTMGALPLGTMNLFVQALGFSATIDEVIAQFAQAKPIDVDVGFANDRVFLHQVSFGLQPRMARLREKIGYSSRFTKMFAAARAFLILMMRPRTVRVALRADDEVRKVKSPLLIVSNNPLGRPGHVSLPLSLDSGKLGLYILDHISLPKLVSLARDYLRSDLAQNPAIEARIVETVELNTPGNPLPGGRKRKGILSSMDGEVVLLDTPVKVSIRRKALNILVMPQPSGSSQPS